MQIGLRLFDGGLGPRDARLLLAVVEAGQHRALGDALADIGAQIDQHAGNLEADLGGDARFDGAETEHLHRHVAGNAVRPRPAPGEGMQTRRRMPAAATTTSAMISGTARFRVMACPTSKVQLATMDVTIPPRSLRH